MQKKLIVLAIAALASTSAFAADSTVTLYGVADAAVVNVSGSGIVGGTTVISGGLAASRVGVKAVEPLDNGLTAVAVAEIGLDAETNQGFSGAARQQMLALAGGFGTVATGYLQTTGYDFGVKYNPVAGSAVSPLGDIVKKQGFLIGDQGAANRAQRAVAYISPDMGGLVVAVNYAFALAGYGDVPNATTTAGSNISASLVSANYTAGPLAVGVVMAATNAEAYTANTLEYALGGSYDLGVAKISATYQTSKHDNAPATNAKAAAVAVPYALDPTTGLITGSAATKASLANANTTASNTAFSVGVTAPVASGVLALSYAASNIKNIADGAAGQNASGYTVAFLQPMSKTTTAYLAYNAMTQGNGTTSVTPANGLFTTDAGGNCSVIALGLNKKF